MNYSVVRDLNSGYTIYVSKGISKTVTKIIQVTFMFSCLQIKPFQTNVSIYFNASTFF